MERVKNPILPGFYPDPSICRVGEDFYLATSTFAYSPGVPVFHSRDLLHWKQIGNVLTRKEQLNIEGTKISEGIFAPTIRYHKGVFYMITTNVTYGGNFYVTAEKPEGPWSDPIWLSDAPGIDPSLYFEGDDCYYVGQRNKENAQYYGDCEVWLQSLDVNKGKLVGEISVLWDGAMKNVVWPEGPHIYKRDGWYYLIYSEGGTAFEHSICTARSRDIRGPYEGCKMNPIFTHRHLGKEFPVQNTGHCDMVELENGDCYMVMLATRPMDGCAELGRETFLAEVIWEEGWPVINPGIGHLVEKLHVEIREPEEENIEDSSIEESSEIISFADNKELLMCRCPNEKFYEVVSENRIVMDCAPQIISELNATPSYLGIRQKKRDFIMETEMEFLPEGQEEAGLLYFYDESNYLSFTLVKKGIKLCAQVKLVANGQASFCSDTVIRSKKGRYKMRISGNKQTLMCKVDNTVIMKQIKIGMLSSEKTGGFVGCTMGLYATGNGMESEKKAVFQSWKVK